MVRLLHLIAAAVGELASFVEHGIRWILVGLLCFGLGFAAGVWWEGQAIWRLFSLPPGEMTATVYPSVIWQRTGPRILAYRPLPTWSQAQVVDLFGPEPPAAPVPATPSTTLPPEPAKKERRK